MQSQCQIIASPLNYTGGKARLFPQIRPLFPDYINTFVDLFCGGCNVGINTKAERYYYNDISEPLIGLYQTFLEVSEDELISDFDRIINSYNLSDSTKHTYEYYSCNSSEGLAAYNKSKFENIRDDFNALTQKDKYYYELFYMLIVFGFNNQIRFNKNGQFNLPVGKRDFNFKIRRKLSAFLKVLKKQKPVITNIHFNDYDMSHLNDDCFVYCDPPYLIATAAYNENGKWTEKEEYELLGLLDRLNAKKLRFALSNVLSHKGKENKLLKRWTEKNRYKVHHLNFGYTNSNYHTKDKVNLSDEVLIVNY